MAPLNVAYDTTNMSRKRLPQVDELAPEIPMEANGYQSLERV